MVHEKLPPQEEPTQENVIQSSQEALSTLGNLFEQTEEEIKKHAVTVADRIDGKKTEVSISKDEKRSATTAGYDRFQKLINEKLKKDGKKQIKNFGVTRYDTEDWYFAFWQYEQ